jgi:hypothetical protein
MRKIIQLIILLISISGYSQNYKITYLKSSNGNLIENQDAILVFCNETKTLISTEKIITKKAEFPFEQTLVSRDNGFYSQITNLSEKEIISTKDSTSLKKQTFELSNETKKYWVTIAKKLKLLSIQIRLNFGIPKN